MRKTKVINFYGGPSSGKSTMAKMIASRLNFEGVVSEYIQEYAKELVWAKNFEALKDQFLISATQHSRVFVLDGQVDYSVTDSPLIMSLAYTDDSDVNLRNTIIDYHNRYDNINVWVNRDDERYSEIGRTQTLEESKELDEKIRQVLSDNNVTIHFETSKLDSAEDLYRKVLTITN